MLAVKEISGTRPSRQSAVHNTRGIPTGEHCHSDVTINPSAIYNLRYELECARDSVLKEALQKNNDFSFSCEEEVPVAFWDISSLRARVLNNMLSNAIRYTPVGGKIAMSVKRLNNYQMLIQISDSRPSLTSTDEDGIVGNYTGQDAKDNSHRVELNRALKCIYAHRGTLNITNDSVFSGVSFLISLPLYELCLQ